MYKIGSYSQLEYDYSLQNVANGCIGINLYPFLSGN